MKVSGVFKGLTFLFLSPLYIYLHLPRTEGRETDMMLSVKQRLRSLEQQAAWKDAALFTVSFRDGARRKLPPGDAITAVLDGNVYQVDGMPGKGNGLLLELLQGLLEE